MLLHKGWQQCCNWYVGLTPRRTLEWPQGPLLKMCMFLHAFTQGRVHRHLTRLVFSKKPSRPLGPGGQAVKYQNENIPIGFLDPKNVGVDPKIRVVGVKLVEILNKIYRVWLHSLMTSSYANSNHFKIKLIWFNLELQKNNTNPSRKKFKLHLKVTP